MTVRQIVHQNRENVSVGKSSKGYGLSFFVNKDFNKGETIMSGFGKVIDHQTPHISVQIGYGKHYLPFKWTGKYWNHSCDPNTYVKSRPDGFPDLVALRDIKDGEEINYGYWMTEFAWIKNADELKVRCKCGAKKCMGRILAFSDLPEKDQKMLKKKKLCSRYLYTQP